jgi:hypothetical protein
MIGSVTEIDTAKSELSGDIDIASVVDIGKVSFASVVVVNVKESPRGVIDNCEAL